MDVAFACFASCPAKEHIVLSSVAGGGEPLTDKLTVPQIVAINESIRDLLSTVSLIGEASIGDEMFESYCLAFRALGTQLQSAKQFDDLRALCIVFEAQRSSDGREVWEPIERALHYQHGAGSRELGPFFEKYLGTRGFLTFSHLVDDGAMRYRAPILAHAILPRRLASAFVDQVIWPALTSHRFMDASPDDIRARMRTNPPPGLPETVHRFLLYGGAVSEDILNRSLEYGRLVQEQPGVEVHADHGLPVWLAKEIARKVKIPAAGAARRPRHRSPWLEFDAQTNALVLQLPYLEPGHQGRWLRNGGRDGEWNASPAAWRRIGSEERVEFEDPFTSFAVQLETEGSTHEWRIPGLVEGAFAFFRVPGGKLVSLPEAQQLSGHEWFVLRRHNVHLTPVGGSLRRVADYGMPSGFWHDFSIEHYEATGCNSLVASFDDGRVFTWPISQEIPKARLEVPSLPFLRSFDGSVLGTEDALPTVILPRPLFGVAEAASLAAWSLTIASRGDNAETYTRRVTAPELSPERTEAGWRLGLADLIPGEDVGEWQLTVDGPLGQGLNEALTLLPRLEIRAYAAPQFAGGPARDAMIHVEAELELLEEDDDKVGEAGTWLVSDRNGNGRIPLRIRDPRTGRTARALLDLPTIRWRLRGHENNPRFTLHPAEFLGDQESVLYVDAELPSAAAAPDLTLVLEDEFGNRLQEHSSPPMRFHRFPMSAFSSTVLERGHESLRFVLRSDRYRISTTVLELRTPPSISDAKGVIDDESYLNLTWTQSARRGVTKALLLSEARPWESAIEARVDVDSQGNCHAVFGDDDTQIVPGPYVAKLFASDDWHGDELVAAVPINGYADENLEVHLKYLERLPPSAAHTLELLALKSPRDRGAMLTIRPEVQRYIGDSGSDGEGTFLSLLATAVRGRNGVPPLWTGIPWHLFEEERTAAKVKLDEEGVRELLISVADSHSAGAHEITRFLCSLGIHRLQALPRILRSLESASRIALWNACPAFAAIGDSEDVVGRIRARDGLGLPSWPSPVEARALVQSLTPTSRFLASPAAIDSLRQQPLARPSAQGLLTDAAWRRACILSLVRLVATAPARRLISDFREIFGPLGSFNVHATVSESITVRRPMSVAGWEEELATYSLLVALWDRLVAKRRVVDTQLPSRKATSGLAARLLDLIPDLHVHDMCLAPLLIP